MFRGNTWRIQLAGPVLCAALMAACAGDDGRTPDEQRGQKAQADKAEPPAQALVSLSGCIEVAAGRNNYTLTHVRFEPRQSGDPHRDTTTTGAQGITEGSWVRLTSGGKQDLDAQAGKLVTITGVVTDSGQNTIGTGGATGVVTPSGDASQAASKEHYSDKMKTEAGRIGRESMADGTAAEVRVQQVQPSGEKCPLDVKGAAER